MFSIIGVVPYVTSFCSLGNKVARGHTLGQFFVWGWCQIYHTLFHLFPTMDSGTCSQQLGCLVKIWHNTALFRIGFLSEIHKYPLAEQVFALKYSAFCSCWSSVLKAIQTTTIHCSLNISINILCTVPMEESTESTE